MELGPRPVFLVEIFICKVCLAATTRLRCVLGCWGEGCEEQEDEEKEQLICDVSSGVAKTLVFT